MLSMLIYNNSYSQQSTTSSNLEFSYKDNGAILLDGVTIDPNLKDYLLAANKSADEKTIIFTFEDNDQAVAARKKMLDLGAEFVGPEFKLTPMQGAKVTASELLAIAEIDEAYGIWENRELDTELHEAVVVSSVSDTWADSEFTTLNEGIPLSGRGVGVVVNDSGFDGIDTDIQTTGETGADGKIYFPRMIRNVEGTNNAWVEDGNQDTDPGEGHGSHVMGIVGGDGRRSDGKFTGVAPGSSLIGYSSAGPAALLGVAGGFEYARLHKDDYNIRIITNSFGGATTDGLNGYDPTDGFSVASKAAVDAGLVVVFSAGNSGPEDNTITGNYKISPWVIAVGNGTKGGALAGSSSRGAPDPNGEHPSVRGTVEVPADSGIEYLWENRPAVTAPGSSIVSVKATAGGVGVGDVGLSNDELPYYTFKTGTSMAAPHVAGIVALMIEANPKLEWRAAKAILQRTAITSMSEEIYQRGAGYVNAWAATAAAFHGLCDAGEDATYEEKYGLPTNGSFGFDTDPWKTCPLTDEVITRLKDIVPRPDGVPTLCQPNEPIVTDSEGDSASPSTDIIEVDMIEETATDFKITMKIAEGLATGQGGVASEFLYGVKFTLDKGNTSDARVGYIVNTVFTGPIGDYRLQVIRGDNPNLGSTHASFNKSIDGSVDFVNNTITWTVPKAELNAEGNPPDNTTEIPNSGPGAESGHMLIEWQGLTRQRGVLSLVANLDDTSGACFRILE